MPEFMRTSYILLKDQELDSPNLRNDSTNYTIFFEKEADEVTIARREGFIPVIKEDGATTVKPLERYNSLPPVSETEGTTKMSNLFPIPYPYTFEDFGINVGKTINLQGPDKVTYCNLLNSNSRYLNLVPPQLLSQYRANFPRLLAFYDEHVAKINPASFPYLELAQQEAYQEELAFAYILFDSQYQLDKLENRKKELENLATKAYRCLVLIEKLNPRHPLVERKKYYEGENRYYKVKPNKNEKQQPSNVLFTATGIPVVATWVPLNLMELSSSKAKTTTLRNWMDSVNGKRLYWVWAGNMLPSFLELLSDEYIRKPQAHQALASITPITGYMSWILYYARFSIHFGLLLKHTLPGPWMTPEEKQIDPKERLKVQWQQRKYNLINDSIWGIANMACHLWLKGSGMLGYYGNVLTVGLLFMDAIAAYCRLREEKAMHKQEITAYEIDLAILKGCALSLMTELPNDITTYKNSFIYCKNGPRRDLYYIKSNGEYVKVTIRNFTQFDEYVTDINEHRANLLYLNSDQLRTLITSNGAHTQMRRLRSGKPSHIDDKHQEVAQDETSPGFEEVPLRPEDSAVNKIRVKTQQAMKESCEFNWQFTLQRLELELYYSLALIVTFSIACGVLLLPGTLSLLSSTVLTAVGFGLCFILNTIKSAWGNYIEIKKSKKQLEMLGKKLCEEIGNYPINEKENQQVLNHLKSMQLMKEKEYLKNKIDYQQWSLLRSTLLDIFIPPFVITSLLFFSWNIGLLLLTAGFFIAAGTNQILEEKLEKLENWKNSPEWLPKFNEPGKKELQEKIRGKGCSFFNPENSSLELTNFSEEPRLN